LEQNFKKLNIMLAVCLALFVLPWILIPYKVIYVPESMSMPILMVALIFGILYCVVLGILASKKNRSVFKWVVLSIIFLPIGFIVSFLLMLSAKPLPKDE
jgi:quinol-cytochrome oxidoreductase complex cytochrome b subunit